VGGCRTGPGRGRDPAAEPTAPPCLPGRGGGSRRCGIPALHAPSIQAGAVGIRRGPAARSGNPLVGAAAPPVGSRRSLGAILMIIGRLLRRESTSRAKTRPRGCAVAEAVPHRARARAPHGRADRISRPPTGSCRRVIVRAVRLACRARRCRKPHAASSVLQRAGRSGPAAPRRGPGSAAGPPVGQGVVGLGGWARRLFGWVTGDQVRGGVAASRFEDDETADVFGVGSGVDG
jgi:hypothetical protein